MHGFENDNPTPVDTFRVLNYMLKRMSHLHPDVNAKHMRNIEAAFGLEVTQEALKLYHLDVATERGTLTYTEEGVAYDGEDQEAPA